MGWGSGPGALWDGMRALVPAGSGMEVPVPGQAQQAMGWGGMARGGTVVPVPARPSDGTQGMGCAAGWADSPVLARQLDAGPGGPAGAQPAPHSSPRPTARTDPLSPPRRRRRRGRPRSRVAAARDADGAVEDLQADGAAELRLQRLGRGAGGGRRAGGAGPRGLGALRRRHQQAAEHGGGGREGRGGARRRDVAVRRDVITVRRRRRELERSGGAMCEASGRCGGCGEAPVRRRAAPACR